MDTTPCTYRISVKAVIKDAADRVMLVRQTDGYWELPGGGLEHSENVRKALAREIQEETGLTVEHINPQPEMFYTIQKDVDAPGLRWFAFVVYEVTASGTFQSDPTSKEAQEARYCTADEARALQLHANTKPYFNFI
ncbi:MAG TPA: NUDIX hydrolase [Candidatus Saccharimonadia bacterium]|nr:NUDIX hydrolase [Candidatus Saccharimonadia bacterium]